MKSYLAQFGFENTDFSREIATYSGESVEEPDDQETTESTANWYDSLLTDIPDEDELYNSSLEIATQDYSEDEVYPTQYYRPTPVTDYSSQEGQQQYTRPINSSSSGHSNFAGIMHVEGARTGQSTNLNSSAIGRGQMIKGTRQAMYKKLGIRPADFATAEARFKRDPEFEQQVMNAYRDELASHIPAHVQGMDREYMIAKGWYTGDVNYPDDKVPHPEAGNRLTAGAYARQAIKHMEHGGDVYAQVGFMNPELVQSYVDPLLTGVKQAKQVQQINEVNEQVNQHNNSGIGKTAGSLIGSAFGPVGAAVGNLAGGLVDKVIDLIPDPMQVIQGKTALNNMHNNQVQLIHQQEQYFKSLDQPTNTNYGITGKGKPIYYKQGGSKYIIVK